jgi:uncharacterized cupin superfamily protein
MDKPMVVNLNELAEPQGQDFDHRFGSRHVPIGAPLGAKKLGYNLTVVPPGKKAFPYHFHHVNEELFLILDGTGELRWPGGTRPLKPMDLVCCPPGADGAHQIINPGTTELRCLALSTIQDPEVVEYPDSGKYGVIAGRPLGGKRDDAAFAVWAFKKGAVNYWEGE